MTTSIESPPLPPREQRHFEDYLPGAIYTFPPIPVTEEEVLEYASRYDPQPMHTDPKWAAQGPFGGLIASGWHTIALLMRSYVDNYLGGSASLVSPGVDEVRWRKPVRPGDILTPRVTILDSKRFRSDPSRGAVRALVEGLDSDGAVVASFIGVTFMKTRDPTAGD